MSRKKATTTPIQWQGCYDDSWQGIITPASFAHPAKFSKNLIERILRHLEENDYIGKGDIIGDPFGGVGTGGIVAAYRGFQWIGQELEKKFFDLGAGNFEKHGSRWARLGVPGPILIHGDSRRFHENVRAVIQAIVSSPPYVSGGHHTDVMDAGNANGRGQRMKPACQCKFSDAWRCAKDQNLVGQIACRCSCHRYLDTVITSPAYSGSLDDGGPEKAHPDGFTRTNNWVGYGKSPGQIARLKTGDVDAVVGSPPFLGARSDTTSSGGGINVKGYEGKSPARPSHKRMGERTYQSGKDKDREGDNIESLPAGNVEAIVSSPPYEAISAGAGGLNHLPARKPGQQTGRVNASNEESMAVRTYGKTPGQISRAKTGPVEAIISSPPYADSVNSQSHGIDFSKSKPDYPGRVNHPERNRKHSEHADNMRYGDSPGQIGTLRAVVSSPPWENNVEGGRRAGKFKGDAVLKSKRGKGATDEAVLAQAARDEEKTLGDSPGQIGQEKGETYWQAMAKVYHSCFLVLKPGGVMAIVVKDFVKDKKRMPLCDDTMRLLVWLGFEEVERIHAMLTEDLIHEDLFEGERRRKKEKKSFFRRLHESRLAPDDPRRIDYEEVLIVRKPA